MPLPPNLAGSRCSFVSRTLLLAALLSCLWVATGARGDTIALSFTGGDRGLGGVNQTFGWSFTVSQSIFVTQLGFFDVGSDGVVDAHMISIWSSTGALLAQATVPAGTAAALVAGTRYVSLPGPLQLGIGSYVIGASYPTFGDKLAALTGNLTTASPVTYTSSRFGDGNAFPTGDDSAAAQGFFGPNFQFVQQQVSDSGTTLVLLLSTVLVLLGLCHATSRGPARRGVEGK